MRIKNLSIDSLTHDAEESVTRRDPKREKNHKSSSNKKDIKKMALHVKYPKTCRNKKQSAALFLTPPDSSLSSSSGSLSSGNSERKQHPKRKPLRYKGHTTLLATIPKRKKLKTKKSSSGSDSDCVPALRANNNSLDETNRNALYSSCKSFVCIQLKLVTRDVICLRPRECLFPVVQSRIS